MTLQLPRDKKQLCSIQGRLFVLAAASGHDAGAFIDSFMRSETAARMDLPYDRLQWAGEEYILGEVMDELGERGDTGAAETLRESCESPSADTWAEDELFWTGWLYRLWHYVTGESSAEISRATDAATMRACYPGYHTLDPEAAIERLRETAGTA